jgi:hypothetical protein
MHTLIFIFELYVVVSLWQNDELHRRRTSYVRRIFGPGTHGVSSSRAGTKFVTEVKQD